METLHYVNNQKNAELNNYMKQSTTQWDTSKKWVEWDTKDNFNWYTVLDSTDHPSNDNIIERNVGEFQHLSRLEACTLWGDNVGRLSLDNGQTYHSVMELSDQDVHAVMQFLEQCATRPTPWDPENSKLIKELEGFSANERDWLSEFVSRLCKPWIVG